MIAPLATAAPVAEIELQLLLDGIYRYSGYDFRDYTPAFVRRRISERMRAESVRTISALQDLVLHDGDALDRLVYGLSVSPGELFGDPRFFAEFRRAVVPMLRTFPFVRIWVLGCGTGEDAYALAITLLEEDLYRRCKIYATDVSATAIALAKEGRIRAELLDGAFRRYRDAGGKGTLEAYISLEGESPALVPKLRDNIIFSTHNLVSDGSFNEFHTIVCRGVLSQYNKGLAYRGHHVIFESLARSGYLAIGPDENLRYAPHQRCYERVSDVEQIYRRIR